MGIQTTGRFKPHWNYFLALERELDVLSRYIEFDKRNFGSFSIETARILLAAGAECDVVCKMLCRRLQQGSKASSIGQYCQTIRGSYPHISDFRVLLPRFDISLTPWRNWRHQDRDKSVPLWWTAYNKTKHQRDTRYQDSSLKNALNAVSGLFVMVLHLYRTEAEGGKLVPSPELLRADAHHFAGISHGSYYPAIVYRLQSI